jgi:hypothetical protein
MTIPDFTRGVSVMEQDGSRTIFPRAGVDMFKLEWRADGIWMNLWEWVIWSNPIAEAVLTELSLSESERGTIQRAMEKLVRERAGGSGSARLSNPINVGIGTR